MEWTTVTVIIAIVGLIGTVAVPLTKNTKAMTQLSERFRGGIMMKILKNGQFVDMEKTHPLYVELMKIKEQKESEERQDERNCY